MLELIKKAHDLSIELEKQAVIELNFCIDTSILLENFSWEIYRLTNQLREIKEYKGI